MVRHAGRPRREDRKAGAALALELELRAFYARTQFVIADIQGGPRRLLLGVLDGGNLVLAKVMQLLRLRGVVTVAVDDHGASLIIEMMPPGSRCANGREGDAIVKRIDIDFCPGQQPKVKWASHLQLSSPSPDLIGGLTGQSSNHRVGSDTRTSPAPEVLDRPVKSGEGDDTGEQSCSKIPIASGD